MMKFLILAGYITIIPYEGEGEFVELTDTQAQSLSQVLVAGKCVEPEKLRVVDCPEGYATDKANALLGMKYFKAKIVKPVNLPEKL